MLSRITHRATAIYADYYKKKARNYCQELSEGNPIIVLGVQKSGTTAISALLAEAANKSVTLDIQKAIKRPEWKAMIRYGIGSFEEFVYRYRRDFKSEIIKEPGLTFFYEDLVGIFPDAKFLMIVRDPLDNIRSILNRLNLPGHLGDFDVNEYPEIRNSVAWRMNLDTCWMGYNAKNYVDALAYRWKLGARVYLSNRKNITLVKYEDFLQRKQDYIENLCGHLGFAVVADVESKVETQYQPKGNKAVILEDFFGENYQVIDEMCRPEASELGYIFK